MYPLVGNYVHHNREKAAVIVLCLQTDFAARTQIAIDTANKIAMYAVGFESKSPQELMENEEVTSTMLILANELKENIKLCSVFYINGNELIKNK